MLQRSVIPIWNPELQDRLYLKLLGPTLESKKWLGNVTTDFICQCFIFLTEKATYKQTPSGESSLTGIGQCQIKDM